MDQSSLVDNQILDGRRFVERFAVDGNPVLAAFWAKAADEDPWFLYVMTETIDRAGPAAAYRAAHESMRKLGPTCVANSEIKLIGSTNPVAKDVLAIMARYPGRLGMRHGGRTLGALSVDQVYVYPPRVFSFTPANPMTTEDVGKEIFRLMNRGPGLLNSSPVALKDGTGFNGVPFSFQFGSQNAVVVSFIADGEPAPRVVRLDEIASIS